MIDTTAKIRADAERGAALLMRLAENADDEGLIAIADGLINGAIIALTTRLGVERAHEIVQRHYDVLDRSMLDHHAPRRPANACRQV